MPNWLLSLRAHGSSHWKKRQSHDFSRDQATHRADRARPENITAAVKGVDGKTLRYKPAPNKWCILEILAHLADAEVVFGHRIRQCLAEADSTICPMDQDAWANNLRYMEASAEE